MKLLNYGVATLLLLAACQSKTEQADEAVVLTKAVAVSDLNSGVALSTNKSMSQIAVPKKPQVPDSLAVEETEIGCYTWTNTYLATTDIMSEEGDHYELHIAITLTEEETDSYKGYIEMFLSDCEDQTFQGTVKAVAEKNYVTVYFEKNVDGMEDMFKKGDKLVQFEYSFGEIVASWFGVMSPYVDEYTVLSLAH